MSEASTVLQFEDRDALRDLCGPADANLRLLGETLRVLVTPRGNTLTIQGQAHDVDVAHRTTEQLYEVVRKGYPIYPPDVQRGIEVVASGAHASLSEIFLDTVLITSGKRRISPKNLHQKEYIDGIRRNDLAFGVGPAGTGKTYLAMAMAVAALTAREVKRIILTRPAVEAGERLGFLPGDMTEKVNPYLRPLYDALYDMMDFGRVQRLIAENTIEVAPLAFMRGRTLNDAFIVLDEAQNTTREQMKMFLTRLGFNSQAVVTGDITQTDLPDPNRSGLAHAAHILQGIDGIHVQHFTSEDVVRHSLVMRILNAYESERPAQPGASGPVEP